ncbi:BF3164 family lipoprotein [Alistipes dispar]|uniref:BF3164 family lipoprotein n=1 Tax=Alistipes dispar TaxID=2585119 RepID=UPI00248CC5CB|nr:BF3164 family lipoprotein [Alistipes dispar]
MKKVVVITLNVSGKMNIFNYFTSNKDWHLMPILIISLIFIVGCSPKIKTPYKIITEFPIEQQLKGKPFAIIENNIGIIDVKKAGPYLICKEHKTEYHFTIYDSIHQKTWRWGRNGRGPHEYLAPSYWGLHEKINNGVRIQLLEQALKKLQTIDITCTSDSIAAHVVSTFSIPYNLNIDPRILVRKNANTLYGISDFGDCRFFKCDSTFRNIEFLDHVLPFNKNASVHDIAQSCSGVKPDKEMIAVAYFNLPQLTIYSYKGNVVQTIFIDKIIQPKNINVNDAEEYFLDINVDDHYIYALYDSFDSEQSGQNSILIFDWHGNPIAKYRIPRASRFAIDKLSKQIITVNADQTNSMCSVYTFNL